MGGWCEYHATHLNFPDPFLVITLGGYGLGPGQLLKDPQSQYWWEALAQHTKCVPCGLGVHVHTAQILLNMGTQHRYYSTRTHNTDTTQHRYYITRTHNINNKHSCLILWLGASEPRYTIPKCLEKIWCFQCDTTVTHDLGYVVMIYQQSSILIIFRAAVKEQRLKRELAASTRYHPGLEYVKVKQFESQRQYLLWDYFC